MKAADLIHEDTEDRWEDESAQKGLRDSKTSEFLDDVQANCGSENKGDEAPPAIHGNEPEDLGASDVGDPLTVSLDESQDEN